MKSLKKTDILVVLIQHNKNLWDFFFIKEYFYLMAHTMKCSYSSRQIHEWVLIPNQTHFNSKISGCMLYKSETKCLCKKSMFLFDRKVSC